MRIYNYAALIAIAPLLMATPVIASGGGGGGGGSYATPSESAPQYNAAAEYQKGVVALEAKDYKAAKSAFDHALTVTPRDANSQYFAGFARMNLGDWKGAKRFFEKAIKLDTAMVRGWRDLGLTYAKLGETANAQTALDKLKIQTTACNERCAQASDLKTAVDSVAAALAGTPVAVLAPGESLLFASAARGDGLYLGAVSLINEGRYEAAIETLHSAQSSFGAHPDVLTYLGFANRKLGRFDVAEGYYQAALSAAPGHRGATEYYGELKVERGDLNGARAMLATLDAQCRFGCAEAEELRRWVVAGHSPHS